MAQYASKSQGVAMTDRTIAWPCACGCLSQLVAHGPRVVCWHCKTELPMLTLEGDDE